MWCGLQKLGFYILEVLGRFAAAFYFNGKKSRHREKFKI
jgi:hypothetical protein